MDFKESESDSDQHSGSDDEDYAGKSASKATTCRRAERETTLTNQRRAFAKEFKG